MNKLYENIMNGADADDSTISRLYDWLDSNIDDGYRNEDLNKVELYEMMKKDLTEYLDYLY